LQKVITKYVQTEPKIELPELAYLIWELGDHGDLDISKLSREIIKCIKSKV
jgi:hypothetical protein